MMKILILTHEFPPCRGGIGTYASELARAAHELGNEITVVAPDFGHELGRSDRRDYPFQVIRYHSSEYSYRKFPALMWRTWRWSRSGKYDLIHAADSAHILSLAVLNKFLPTPFVATVHGGEILAMPSSKQARWLGVANLLEVPEWIYAISLFTQELLLRHCPSVPPDRVRVTPLGVAPRWFERPKAVRRILDKFDVAKDYKLVLTVARLDERKGHRTVLKGIAKLDVHLKRDLSYVVVGKCNNATYFRELQRLAAGCGAHVRFTGDITDPEVHALYAAADIYCMPGEAHPKKVEGFGLVYLEAAAQKTPSIASRIGGVPEAVLHGETGLLIEPGDHEALSEALRRLLTDESYREKLGNAAYDHARSFSWKRCAEMTYGE